MRRRREGVLDIRIDSPNRMNENYYSANQQHFRISSGHRPITYIHSVFTKALNHICVRVLLHNRSNRAEFKLAALSHCKIIYKSSGPCEHVSMPMTVLYMCVYMCFACAFCWPCCANLAATTNLKAVTISLYIYNISRLS